MKTVKYRLFMAWEHEEEEQWLAEMESQGWHLTDVFWIRYQFEKGEANKYQYRLEMLPEVPSHPKRQEYIQFIEDTGAEMIGSYLKWVYFRKKNDGSKFEIYSDADSKLKHFKRIYKLLTTLMIVLSAILVMDYALCIADNSFSILVLIPTIVAVALMQGVYKIKNKIKKLEEEKGVYE